MLAGSLFVAADGAAVTTRSGVRGSPCRGGRDSAAEQFVFLCGQMWG